MAHRSDSKGTSPFAKREFPILHHPFSINLRNLSLSRKRARKRRIEKRRGVSTFPFDPVAQISQQDTEFGYPPRRFFARGRRVAAQAWQHGPHQRVSPLLGASWRETARSAAGVDGRVETSPPAGRCTHSFTQRSQPPPPSYASLQVPPGPSSLPFLRVEARNPAKPAP